jgi:hypothetical protein
MLRTSLQAPLVFVVSAVLYLLLLQEHSYGDGVLYLDYARKGVLASTHMLYMPGLQGFTGLFEAIGLPERWLAFAYSAIAAAAGNGFLFAVLRRHVAAAWSPWIALLLVGLAPSVLFFGTTVEVHGQQYGFACFALWAFHALLDRERVPWPNYVLAGLLALAAPLAHETGWMLFAFFAPMAAMRCGRERPFAGFGLQLLRGLAFLAVPMLFWLGNDAFRNWLFLDVYGQQDAITNNPSEIYFNEFILADARAPRMPPLEYLLRDILRPAWAIVLVGFALLYQLRRQTGLFLTLLLSFGASIALLITLGIWERGAYFLGLLPLLGIIVARVAQGRVLLVTLALLGAGQAVDALLVRNAYVTELEYPLWAWGSDVDALVAAELGQDAKVTVLCNDIFQEATLRYEHELGAQQVTGLIQARLAVLEQSPEPERLVQLAALRQLTLTWIQGALLQGTTLLTPELRNTIETQLPTLYAQLSQLAEFRPLQHGRAQLVEIRVK